MKTLPALLMLILFSRGLDGQTSDMTWTQLNKRFTEARAEYEGAEKSLADKKSKKSKDELEQEATAYLRSLLLYESAVRVLGDPTDEVSGFEKNSEFSSQESRSIQKLRQGIRDAERKRISKALASDSDLAGDDDAAESILKDELRLDGFFQSNSRKLLSAISKLERDLGKIQRETNRDDPRRLKVKEEIVALKEKVATIHETVFGFRYGSGFRDPVDKAIDGKGATLLQEIVSEREKILAFLKGEQPSGVESEGKAGTVGGSFLYSFNLGVVLDISGSMTPFLEDLRDEIESFFEAPRYREVVGCRLNGCHIEHLRTKRSPKKWATMSVIEELIVVREVDTVYWFSDLKDEQDAISVRRLRELLMRGGTRFHVKSLGKKPSRELDRIITDFQD